MRIIVPLQGVVQGRGGLFWGSLIPCALFYFLQLHFRHRRPSAASDQQQQQQDHAGNSADPASHHMHSSSSFVAPRAMALLHSPDSPHHLGWKEYGANPFNATHNPDGVIQLSLAENRLCLDLLEDWLISHEKASLSVKDGSFTFKDVAPYQYSHGMLELKSVLAPFLEDLMGNHIPVRADNIVLTAGASAAIDILAFSLGEAGDAFLVPSPYYPGFDSDIVLKNGVQLVSVCCPSSEGFRISRLELERSFDKAQKQGVTVRALLLTSPGNPVGNVLDVDTLRSLLRFAKEKHIHVISDEIYAGSVFEGNFSSVAALASIDYDIDMVHIIYGLSKDFGIPGFRVGILYTTNDKLLACAQNLARFCTVSSHTQKLLVSLFEDRSFVKMFMEENKRRLSERYHHTVKGLVSAGIHCTASKAGLYCWIDMRHLIILNSLDGEKDLWKRLLYEAKVCLTPGSACHCSEAGWFRLCFGNVDGQTLDIALERLKTFTNEVVKN